MKKSLWKYKKETELFQFLFYVERYKSKLFIDVK